MKKRILAAIMAIMMMVSVFAPTASAASIASNKKKATGIYGGQTIYVTTNPSIFAKTGFGTDITIKLSEPHATHYMKTGFNNKIKVETYKKSGSGWSKISSKCGSFNVVHKDGYIVKIELPGQKVQYKVVITPVCTHGISLKECYANKGFSINSIKDVKNFTATLDYGTITKVA